MATTTYKYKNKMVPQSSLKGKFFDFEVLYLRQTRTRYEKGGMLNFINTFFYHLKYKQKTLFSLILKINAIVYFIQIV